MSANALQVIQGVRIAVGCQVCGSPRHSDYLEGRGYHIVRCNDCGLRYINPQPTDQELRDFYADFDGKATWRGDGEERFDRAVCRIVQKIQPSGSVLDIGSSRGNFLLAMRNAGYSVYGVEPSQKNSSFARSAHGIESYTGTVECFLETPVRRNFDIITMLNVLEHVKNPGNVMRGLRSLLKEDGILMLVVPDARLHAFIGRTLGMLGIPDPYFMKKESRPLVGFDPPAHVCSFVPKLIARLVKDSGFKILLLRNAPIVLTQATWKNSLKPMLYTFSQLLYYASLRQVVLGYSTLVVARKRSGPLAQ